MTFNASEIARESVLKLTAYSSARDEFQGSAEVFLDANENAHGSPLVDDDFSRYPDPFHNELRKRLGTLNRVSSKNIFVGNGSDEIIDLLIRVFCDPRRDQIIVCPPTYGMYEVSAATNDVEIIKAELNEDFSLNAEKITEVSGTTTKLLFICSPNNPTGNLISNEDIQSVAKGFPGIVVVDEAYAEFSTSEGFLPFLEECPNVVVTRTLSKAWGLAGLRIGMAFASEEILGLLRKIKPPYNVSEAAQSLAVKALSNTDIYQSNLRQILSERERLKQELGKLEIVEKVFRSDANFLLVRFSDHKTVFEKLKRNGIVVRDRSSLLGCDRCLRITIGIKDENDALLEVVKKIK